MIDKIKKYLNPEMIDSYNFIKSLKDSQDEWKYNFMPDEKFANMKDAVKGSEIYWSEMLYRTHIVVLVSLFKSVRWIDSLENNHNNYYGFCSNLRGLIESCADSLYTLLTVPLTIASDYKAIFESIHNNSPILLIHEKLESNLLHYIQATNLNKDQKKIYPNSFNAKHITEYLDCFKDGNEEIIKLYKFLCGISHPAHEATKLFLFLYKGETIVCGDSDLFEIQLIEDLLKETSEVLNKMFRVFIVNIMGILNLLNNFNIPEIRTNFSKENNIEQHLTWIEIKELMDKSIEKYSEGIKNMEYK